jgi:hypothetical protein
MRITLAILNSFIVKYNLNGPQHSRALGTGFKYGPQIIFAEYIVWHSNYLRFNYI